MYILLTPKELKRLDERPKQDDIIRIHEEMVTDELPGEYTLVMEDGRVAKKFVVSTNRRGNWSIRGESPAELEGVTTLNLHRTRKALETVAKYWPAKQADIRKIDKVLAARAELLGLVGLDLPKPATRTRKAKVAS